MPLKELITNKLGIDKSIFYTLAGRGLQITTSVFTVVFIVKFLSPEEQGFYYTFGSIVAIQVFFELGLTGIITRLWPTKFLICRQTLWAIMSGADVQVEACFIVAYLHQVVFLYCHRAACCIGIDGLYLLFLLFSSS